MSPRNFFYDTEFLENGSTIDLISIGIVADDGSEYYAVNSDMDVDRIKRNDWLCQNVVPHLPLGGSGHRGQKCYQFEGTWMWSLDRKSTLVKPKWVIANEVRDFLTCISEGDRPFLWANYSAYDHVALAQLWGPMIHLPKGIPMWTHDLQQLLEQLPGSFDEPTQLDSEHNALADARHNYRVYLAAMEALS